MNVSDLTENLRRCAGDQDIRRAFDQLFENSADLIGGFALAEDHLGEALPRRAAVVDAGIADVLI